MTDAAPRAPAHCPAKLVTITGPATLTVISMAAAVLITVARIAIDTTTAGSAAPRRPIDVTSDVRGKDVHPLAAGGPHSHRVGDADPADSGLAPRLVRVLKGTITGVPVSIASTGFTGHRITDGTETAGWDPDRRLIIGEIIIALGRPAALRPEDRIVPGTTVRNGRRCTIGTGDSTGRGMTTHVMGGRFRKAPHAATRGQATGREDAARDSGDRGLSASARIASEALAVRWRE